MYGRLHYRCLERDKTIALQNGRGDFDAPVKISGKAKLELNWWKDNIATANNIIGHSNPDIIIESDASHLGWGAVCNGVSTWG